MDEQHTLDNPATLLAGLDLSPAPSVLFDRTDRVVLANDAFLSFTGLNGAEVSGLPSGDLLRDPDGGSPAVRTSAGTWNAVRTRSRVVDEPFGWRIVTVEEAGEGRARVDAEVARIIDAILDPTFLLEPQRTAGEVTDLVIVAGNPALAELAGVPIEVMVGSGIRETSSADEDSLASYERYLDVLRTGAACQMVVPWRRAGQLVATFEVSAQRVGNRVIVTFRNRIEGDEARAALEAAGRRLESLEDDRRGLLAAKRDFLTMASHELRTPVAAILGFAELLAERDLGPEDRATAIEAILRSARRQAQIVASLVDASALEDESLTVARTSVRVGAVIADAVRSVGGIGDRVVVQCPEHLSVVTDPDRLQQIITSFLSNAVKYAAGSPIWITASGSPREVEVTVADNGPGVPAAFIPELFEMFTQAGSVRRRTARGVGLGLHLASAIASALNGSIHYAPNDPHGAVFTLTLPPR